MTTKKVVHKPVIETIINSSALVLTAAGTNMLLSRDYFGFLLVGFGAGLEFFKYWGRKKEFW